MAISGKSLVRTITQNIDRAEVFACDLTWKNSNVTFELGYAIGRFKRIWVSVDESIQNASKDFQRTYFGLLGLGYSEYQNHHDLSNKLLIDVPWRSIDEPLLGEIYRNNKPRLEYPTLLYLKPSLATDAVIEAEEVLRASMFGKSLIVDDPIENPSPSLEWYAEKLRISEAVVVHLLSHDQKHAEEHNLKCSLVAGLAHGFQIPVLMLAHTPFDPPVDYQKLLATHETAASCRATLSRWLSEIDVPRRRQRRLPLPSSEVKELDLRSLSLGEPIAEHESHDLDDYFIETSVYYRAMEARTTIVVGRRGTGKSAILIAMQNALQEGHRNHICIIKPVGYETSGLARVLGEIIDFSERGFLIESLWKFLIISELARSVFDMITSRPAQLTANKEEEQFLDYWKINEEILSAPFSQRLDRAVTSLIGIGGLSGNSAQRARISERLHSEHIREIRRLLGPVLAGRDKVAILIDNLDGSWGPGHHVEYLSELLWGLLEVVENIADDFQHEDFYRKRMNVSLTIFLRSDIFAFIQPKAAEQDKLPIQRIEWDDSELLLRVIDQRLLHSAPKKYNADSIWAQIFPKEVVGLPIKTFIIQTIISRPREAIYLLKEAVNVAINRGHQSVTENDMLRAREKYSEYIFKSILSEDDPRKNKLEAVLYEFAGCDSILSSKEIEGRMTKAQVGASDIEFYVDLLCDVGFLGIQSGNEFRFPSHESERQTLRRIARQMAGGNEPTEEMYRVNPAFYQILQIE